MAKARLMNRPEDYEALGVKPDEVEVWEDGIRIPPNVMFWEWWYFDAVLDDGTKVVIQFFSKSGGSMYLRYYHPRIIFRVNLKDGTEYKYEKSISTDKASWSKEKCDVHYWEHYFTGNLKDYSIHMEPINGFGANLKLHSLSKPYRPGSSYIEFAKKDHFYTWLCVVPRGEVNGTLTLNGKTFPVHGWGYHDHQWGNVNFLKEWNHWVWARQDFGDYSMILFDMVSNSKTEYTRFPLAFIQDKDGNLVFENTQDVKCLVPSEYTDEASGKVYPGEIRYTFENKEKTVDYSLKMDEIIENNGRKNLSAVRRAVTRLAGIDPAYTRYYGEGDLVLTDKDTGEKTERNGKLIYEFMYPGETFKGHM